MPRVVVILLLFSVHFPVASSEPQKVNVSMSEIAKVMKKIYPDMYTIQDELSEERAKQLAANLNRLMTLFEDNQMHFKRSSKTRTISYNVMMSQLKLTKLIIESKQKYLAREFLSVTTSVCLSCHLQDHKGQTLFSPLSRNEFESDFEFAEYSYMTRNMDQALEYYSRYIDSDLKKDDYRIQTALKRKLAIHVLHKKNAGRAINDFVKTLGNASLETEQKEDLAKWIKDLKKWDKSPLAKMNNFLALKRFVATRLDPLMDGKFNLKVFESPVVLLQLLSQINDYINKGPSQDEMPFLLYWLAVSDRGLNYQFVYPMAEYYLRECMERYPTHEVAHMCKKEYQMLKDF